MMTPDVIKIEQALFMLWLRTVLIFAGLLTGYWLGIWWRHK